MQPTCSAFIRYHGLLRIEHVRGYSYIPWSCNTCLNLNVVPVFIHLLCCAAAYAAEAVGPVHRLSVYQRGGRVVQSCIANKGQESFGYQEAQNPFDAEVANVDEQTTD